jgi:hypothetical protein
MNHIHTCLLYTYINIYTHTTTQLLLNDEEPKQFNKNTYLYKCLLYTYMNHIYTCLLYTYINIHTHIPVPKVQFNSY